MIITSPYMSPYVTIDVTNVTIMMLLRTMVVLFIMIIVIVIINKQQQRQSLDTEQYDTAYAEFNINLVIDVTIVYVTIRRHHICF